MLPWEKRIPGYLTTRKNTVSFILFTAAFALVFINIYSPFNAGKWQDDVNVGDVEFFLYSSIVILIGMLVIVISRALMYMVTLKQPLTYGAYALWIVGEILVMAFVYALIQWFFLQEGLTFSQTFRNAVRTTSYIIMLPYIISWLYLSFKDKYTTLENIGNLAVQKLPEESSFKTGAGISLVHFRDEKGMLKFSIKKEDLLYLEAADNYIVIHYFVNQKPAKYMIRNTLKRLEAEMPNASLVRCHRSYMVNMDNVKFIRKEKEGLIIGFESAIPVNIPISKTYIDSFVRKLSGYSEFEEK